MGAVQERGGRLKISAVPNYIPMGWRRRSLDTVKAEFHKLVNSALTEIDKNARATILRIMDGWASERWIG
jgi:hypothetical protein